MKTKSFEIPTDSIAGFAEQLQELELTNEIVGVGAEDAILVDVYYEPNERQAIFTLQEWVEDNVE
jgi:hypothetical protein